MHYARQAVGRQDGVSSGWAVCLDETLIFLGSRARLVSHGRLQPFLKGAREVVYCRSICRNSPLNPQEAALIERLKAGEETAFQTLFRDHYSSLCVYAKRLTGDADGAREVVQDLFVRLYEGRHTWPAPGSLKPYLYAAVRNACLNQLKQAQTRHRHHQQLLSRTPTGEDTDALVQLELEEKIWQAVQDLPEQCRKIFRMNRFEEKKNRQIADELGISVRTVETQISKALRLLRQALSDFLPLLLLAAPSFL